MDVVSTRLGVVALPVLCTLLWFALCALVLVHAFGTLLPPEGWFGRGSVFYLAALATPASLYRQPGEQRWIALLPAALAVLAAASL